MRQTLNGSPAVPRKALTVWIANVDRAEAMHRIDSDPLAAELAADGWIAWRLPEGIYQVIFAGYQTSGLPSRTFLDRYRFRVQASQRALYLASIAYACEPAWWFEALCPAPAVVADELAAAQPVAAAIGLPGADAARFDAVASTGSRAPGVDPARLPQLEGSQTLLMAGDGRSARSVHDYLSQARAERGAPLVAGASMMVQLAPLGPYAAVVALPATVITGVVVAIHGERLKDKAQCLERVWDSGVEAVARRGLEAALQRTVVQGPGDASASAPAGGPRTLPLADAGGRVRHLLALEVQRLALRSCDPSNPWWPDPRGKRFCVEAALRARVYAADAAEPLSDEVFALVPPYRVGHEVEPTGWPIPSEYHYETPLRSRVSVARTYDEYCAADGASLVESDLRRLIDAMVTEVLTLHGIAR